MRAMAVVMVLCLGASLAGGQSGLSGNDLAGKIDKLLASPCTSKDVIRIFGEPQKYVWGNRTYAKNELPDVYIAVYSADFSIVIARGQVHELRHQAASGYRLDGGIGVGSTLEEALAALGQPSKTVTGESIGREDNVLYKDFDGKSGRHYYARRDKRVRLFFAQGKVVALYQTVASDQPASKGTETVTSISAYDDVRNKHVKSSAIAPEVIATLIFNQATAWPADAPQSGRYAPAALMEAGKNPGLGVRKLHEQGITGQGVNVAIIDQPLYQDHPEYAGKIAAYFDTGCESETSMHGPAVTSLLVGQTCGTAPGAKVYYAAAPSWKKDTAYEARALDWIIEQNNGLPADQKIRVVSVSAAPSGENTPFTQNTEQWDQACRRAEAAGILVLDCTRHRCFIHTCWYDVNLPEDPRKCSPGYPHGNPARPNCILAPTSLRTTAEQNAKASYTYIYWGRGGHSWSIPYVAGVLAMGWQVYPQATPQQMRTWLFQSATRCKTGERIVNPPGFINLVRTQKTLAGNRGRTTTHPATP